MGNNQDTIDANIPDFNKKCETCGAKLSDYNRKHQHCNGFWNQEYTFECGSRTKFSPNYMSFIEEKPCPNDPLIKEKNERFKKGVDKLILYIGRMDIEKENKDSLITKVRDYHRWGH